MFLKKFHKIHRKTPVLELRFNNLPDLRTCNFIKKRLQRKCFPVNCAKFTTAPILYNICQQLVLDRVLYTPMIHRSSPLEVFLKKGFWKCTANLRRTTMLKCDLNKVALQFIEIAFWHGCSPVRLLHIFRTPFSKYTSAWLLLDRIRVVYSWIDWVQCWTAVNYILDTKFVCDNFEMVDLIPWQFVIDFIAPWYHVPITC